MLKTQIKCFGYASWETVNRFSIKEQTCQLDDWMALNDWNIWKVIEQISNKTNTAIAIQILINLHYQNATDQ